ncbi:MAG: hypothetical protein HDQ97_10900 [Lachnospiraceae bacterium]|nr:hypothetical protein [Lachnospiraceae bacterium]
MKKSKKSVNAVFAVLVLAHVFTLYGCGRKESDSSQEDYEDYIGIEDSEDSEDSYIWSESVFKINFEGDENAELNGKIESVSPAGTSMLVANTTEGKLFLLDPYIDFYLEDSKIKYYMITDNSHIDDLVYANEHIASGKNQFVYFDTIGEYAESGDNFAESDSYALPEYIYTFSNIQKVDLPDAQNVIFITGDAAYYAYIDTENHVRVDYRDSLSGEYTTYSNVAFIEGESERDNVAVSKGIYQFILTEEQELFYIKNGNVSIDFAGQGKGASINYVDLTDEIGGKVIDIYNLENSADGCYVVDEDHNIYCVSVGLGDDITVNEIAKMDNITITDIQGFYGQNENMLIRTDDGSYYYNDSDSGNTREIENLDQTYEKAVLLMDGNILALGNDGYLYIIEN